MPARSPNCHNDVIGTIRAQAEMRAFSGHAGLEGIMGRKLSSMSFYVTTPIYYVNDRPHIGHCYTTLLADAIARFERLKRGLPMDGSGAGSSSQVFMLTGTDEHAEKVVTTAVAQGLTPLAWADRNSAAFQSAFRDLNLTFDDFIRTTQDRHKDKVTSYLARLLKTGDVAQGEYEGWYDVNDEAYVTENNAKEANYLAGNGKPLVRRKEKNYYFQSSVNTAGVDQRPPSTEGAKGARPRMPSASSRRPAVTRCWGDLLRGAAGCPHHAPRDRRPGHAVWHPHARR